MGWQAHCALFCGGALYWGSAVLWDSRPTVRGTVCCIVGALYYWVKGFRVYKPLPLPYCGMEGLLCVVLRAVLWERCTIGLKGLGFTNPYPYPTVGWRACCAWYCALYCGSAVLLG